MFESRVWTVVVKEHAYPWASSKPKRIERKQPARKETYMDLINVCGSKFCGNKGKYRLRRFEMHWNMVCINNYTIRDPYYSNLEQCIWVSWHVYQWHYHEIRCRTKSSPPFEKLRNEDNRYNSSQYLINKKPQGPKANNVSFSFFQSRVNFLQFLRHKQSSLIVIRWDGLKKKIYEENRWKSEIILFF